jgi:hypothetical protein
MISLPVRVGVDQGIVDHLEGEASLGKLRDDAVEIGR